MTIDISHETPKKSRHEFPTARHKNPRNSYHQCFQKYFHSYQYLKPNPTYITGVNPSVNHWQLRDLIKFDYASNSVFYTRNDAVNRMNLENLVQNNKNVVEPYLNLSYYPRCFNQAGGAVVTGGLLNSTANSFSKNIECLDPPAGKSSSSVPKKGLFTFYTPELDIKNTVRFGETINNDVTIHKRAGSAWDSYVCNNDSNLYCLDISNTKIRIANQICCEPNTSLNNVVRNPTNPKLLMATGDSSSIFLVDPTSQAGKLRSIKTKHDLGFGTSFHPNGYLFSTVFQDGTCLLYDLRNIPKDDKPLVEITSTRPGHQSGAFRVSKFSPENDMNDLLIISEHVGRIHLVDLRNLNYSNANDHQVIVVPFALDQFGEYKTSQEKQFKDVNQVDIYSDSGLSFTAPLVYDYDYLVNSNPQLFKDYFYTPPPPEAPPPIDPELAPPKLNYPQWNETATNQQTAITSVSPTSPQNPSRSNSLDLDQDIDSHLQYVYDNLDFSPTTSRSQGRHSSVHRRSHSQYSNYCEDSFQQSINHIHGEMELAGVEFCNSKHGYDSNILVGCQDSGILMFEVNGIARRSFGSFEYM